MSHSFKCSRLFKYGSELKSPSSHVVGEIASGPQNSTRLHSRPHFWSGEPTRETVPHCPHHGRAQIHHLEVSRCFKTRCLLWRPAPSVSASSLLRLLFPVTLLGLRSTSAASLMLRQTAQHSTRPLPCGIQILRVERGALPSGTTRGREKTLTQESVPCPRRFQTSNDFWTAGLGELARMLDTAAAAWTALGPVPG